KKLAKLHGGDVSIESVLGEGTTVSLWLPYLIGDEKDIPAEPNKIRLKPQHLKGKRILVADDEAYNRELIELILDKWEVQSDIVHDGKAAFEKLQSETYDIALMDLRMPEMDGKSVARRAREELQLDLPILALTATSTEEEVSQALQAGMNGHLLKPFQEADLLATITHLLGLPMEVEEIAPSENAEPEPKIRQDQFSLHALEKLTNHNPAALQRMLALFLDASKENMVAIQVAIQHEDWEEISMRAHRLIPPCRHLGLEAMVEQFKAVEQQANQKRDWPELVEALTEGLDKLQAVNLQVEKHLKTEMGSSK
ncbi:MAG: response regulator, partial [Bacteroidota bacterium]